jgi:hypothetical protein
MRVKSRALTVQKSIVKALNALTFKRVSGLTFLELTFKNVNVVKAKDKV